MLFGFGKSGGLSSSKVNILCDIIFRVALCDFHICSAEYLQNFGSFCWQINSTGVGQCAGESLSFVSNTMR